MPYDVESLLMIHKIHKFIFSYCLSSVTTFGNISRVLSVIIGLNVFLSQNSQWTKRKLTKHHETSKITCCQERTPGFQCQISYTLRHQYHSEEIVGIWSPEYLIISLRFLECRINKTYIMAHKNFHIDPFSWVLAKDLGYFMSHGLGGKKHLLLSATFTFHRNPALRDRTNQLC